MENENWPPCGALSIKEKNLLWSRAIHTWKMTGKLPEFLVMEMAALRDREGDPLSDEVLEFFFDLLLAADRTALRKKETDTLCAVIRSEYRWHLLLEQYGDQTTRLPGESPSDCVKADLATRYKKSLPVIDQIVHPRPSRKSRKPRKT